MQGAARRLRQSRPDRPINRSGCNAKIWVLAQTIRFSPGLAVHGSTTNLDVGGIIGRNAPNIVRRRLAIFHSKMQPRRFVVPCTQQLLPTRAILQHVDALSFRQNSCPKTWS